MWRNDIDPSQVTLGLGWYGRSFTLEDPSCTEPGCRFAAGGNPGECTESSGTLSNAEISRIISANGLSPRFDEKAAVKWITWDNDQWVSYDDGESTQLKIERADRMCLGGTMIWAIDLDDSDNTSADNLLGIGTSNGVSVADKNLARSTLQELQELADIGDTCYWSLCGDTCASGFFGVTSARGTVPGVHLDMDCGPDQAKTLCCTSGTSLGQCAWNGWRGVGMPCRGSCDDSSAIAIARNTNNYQNSPELNSLTDETCNGGAQQYCCETFKPAPNSDTKDLKLLGRDEFAQSSIEQRAALFERRVKGEYCTALAVGTLIGVFALLNPLTAPLAFAGWATAGTTASSLCLGAMLFDKPLAPVLLHGITGHMAPASGTRSGKMAAGFPVPKPLPIGKPKQPNKGKPKNNIRMKYGQYDIFVPTLSQTDCAVTYTCNYGDGWDEVCDNQRWGIDSLLGGQTVFEIKTSDVPRLSKADWAVSRRLEYRQKAQVNNANNEPRCQVDEFPMANLQEAQGGPQVVRLINGPANGAQGRDFYMWKLAKFFPCQSLRSVNGKPPPPVTWQIGSEASRAAARSDGVHFVQKYGFDSQTVGSMCWATYYDEVQSQDVTIHDHGFRVLPDDPMFGVNNWPIRAYHVTAKVTLPVRGGGVTTSYHPPLDVRSDSWLKRDLGDVVDIDRELDNVIEIDLNGMSVEDFVAANPDFYVGPLYEDETPPQVMAVTTSESTPATVTMQSKPSATFTSPPKKTATAHMHEAHLRRHQRHLLM